MLFSDSLLRRGSPPPGERFYLSSRRSKARFLFFLSAAVFLFLSSTPGFGQGYLVHHYTEADGLPSSTVYDIAQDQGGRIWFATRVGIAVYDGVSWRKYTIADGLPGLSFFKIQVDQKGRIWALAHSVIQAITVVYLDTESQAGKNSLPWKKLKMKEPGFDAAKPAVITSFQLLEQQEKADNPVIAVGIADLGVFLGTRGKWEQLTEINGLPGNSVYGIVSLKNRFYVATGKGLSIITMGGSPLMDNRVNESLALPSREIYGIAVQHPDKFPDSRLKYPRIWLYGQKWLGYFEENHREITLYPVEIPLTPGSKKENLVVSLMPDYRCGLYISNRVSINYFNYITPAWEKVRVKSGLLTEGANSLFIDGEKNLWITSQRGVSKISSRRFASFQMIHGLLEDEVTAVLEAEPGEFVLAHTQGLTIYNEKENRFRKISLFPEDRAGLPLVRILEMQRDSQKNIWLAMSGGGLAKVKLYPPYPVTWYGNAHGLQENILCLWIDKNTDHLWVGADLGIFSRGGPGSGNQPEPGFVLQRIGKFTSIPARRIFGESGKLRYIASYNQGVLVNEDHGEGDQDNRWENYQCPGNPKANDVYAIKKDQRGRLFVGTLDGLYILENQSLKKFKSGEFQVDRPVYFILEDTKNRLWFGTDNGVVRWDGKQGRIYTTAEGLIGLETNRAAGIVDSKGRVWIGTNRGVSIYNEAFDHNDLFNPPPNLRLLSVETTSRQIPLEEKREIELAYKENTMVFHFRGISFLDEAALRFRYRLEGFEEKWSAEQFFRDQQIRCTNLPPGEYRLHLKARSALGVWSPEVISPPIFILKPFYRQWWFYLAVILLMGVVFYGIFQLVSGKRYAALLERRVEERTLQLRTMEEQYRRLFEESKDVVFISTPGGKIIDVNPAGLELFGFQSRQEALELDSILNIYNHPEDRAVFQEQIGKNGYVKDYEMILKRKDGEVITVLVTATLVRDKEDKIIAFRGILRDITGQKKLEERLLQAQKMEAIGTLAGGIAHDFNNILAVILGQAELIIDELRVEGGTIEGPRVNRISKSAASIFKAAKRGAEVVKQILTFSRKSKPVRKPVILGSIIKDSLGLLRSILPATIEIRQHIRADSGVILGNPTQIHQVMMNLGVNASHAMQEKGGILGVSLDDVFLDEETAARYSNLKPGPYLKLVVSDTGHGIPLAVMKRLFEPYFTTKKIGEGTGMGLAVIHGIVKNHGGDISIYSEPGQGTVFCVFFPKIEEPVKPEEPLSAELPGGAERILLVEDEESLKEVGTVLLQRLGYHVVGISDPIAALKFFQKDPHQFDLIISDITMPHLTGAQLTREVKSLRPDIPVILCSGNAMAADQINNLGASAFVMKPMVRTEMARVIRKILDGTRQLG